MPDSKKGKKGFDTVIESMAFIAGVLLCLVTLFVSYAVVIRYLGFNPPAWVLQYTEYALLWMTFLGAAWLLREGGHIKIDTIVARLKPRALKRVEIIDHMLGMVVCLIIFWFGCVHTIDLFQRGIMDVKGVSVPKFAFFLVIPIGGLMLLLQFVRDLVARIKSKTGLENN